jgi:hypothetical protein
MWTVVIVVVVGLVACVGAWSMLRRARSAQPPLRRQPADGAPASASKRVVPPASPAAGGLQPGVAAAVAAATAPAATPASGSELVDSWSAPADGPDAASYALTMPMDLDAASDAATMPMDLDAGPAPSPGAVVPLPSELKTWSPISADSLPPQRLQGIAKTFHDVPRPPRLLSRLAALDLTGASGSQELVNLINGEPLIAAKVLAAVNAPAYGLQRPVSAVDQAVTYLGLNTVRSICMHHALQQGFRSDSPDRAGRLKRIWRASALASELALQTSQRVNLPDTAGLACSVLLSFLGQLAVSVAVPRGCWPGWRSAITSSARGPSRH